MVAALLLCVVILAAAAAWFAATAKARQARLDQAQTRSLAAESARTQAASGLAAMRAEYEALSECLGVGVAVLDNLGRFVSANTTGTRLLCPPMESPVGRQLLEATLSEEIEALFRTTLRTRDAQRAEMRLAVGGPALSVTISPVSPGESESHFLLIAEDVTTLRHLETVRRDFVSNVSHELRTPLASIRALAETLHDGALSDPSVAESYLETIVAETLRLTRIAEDLLVLSDAESRAPAKSVFNLSELIDEVLGRLQPQAIRARVVMTSHLAPDLSIDASPDQMEQVIVNLVDNAIKYTTESGRVQVCALREGENVIIRVSDTGIGLMSADLPRIFERFYRVDKARSRKSGGTGLGLAIVKHIVEAHGGRVAVQSEFNHGSTFTVTLPAPRALKAAREEILCR